MTQFNFNVDDYKTTSDVIPAGWYPAVIAAVEDKQTKAGDGRYLSVRFNLTGGQAAGRVHFENINYSNPSSECERIGRETLGKIKAATGLPSLTDSQQLLNQSCMIQLVVKPNGQYGDQNSIQNYKPLESTQAPAAFQPPAPQVQYQAPPAPAVQYQAPPAPPVQQVQQPVVEPWNQPQQVQQVAPQAAPPAWLPPQV